MIGVRTATGKREVAAIRLRTAAGLRNVAAIKIRTATGLRTVWNGAGSLSVTIDADVVGAGSSASAINITTNEAVANVTGAVAPLSYAWTRTDAGLEPWTIFGANAATARFRATAVPAGDTRTATFKVTVTDALGRTGESAAVSATVTNFGGYDGPIL